MPYKDAAKQKEYQRRYHREYHQKRFNKRMEEMVAYLGGVCKQCDNTEQLEFDHIDSNVKSFAIKKKWTLPWEQLQKELDKCQLLCSSCHNSKTDGENGYANNRLGDYECECGEQYTDRFKFAGHRRWCSYG